MKLSLLIIALSIYAIANENFVINEKNISFFRYNDLRITASQKCIKSKQKCKNFQFLDQVSLKRLKNDDNKSVERMRLEVCQSQLKGEVFIGLDKSNNQNSFCYLKEKNLYIDIGTLNYYAEKNDGTSEEILNFPKKRRDKPKLSN